MADQPSQNEAKRFSSNAQSTATAPFLAADVGGTHARIGLVAASGDSHQPVSVLHYQRYRCADWPGLSHILQDFIEHLPTTASTLARPTRCVVACAGYVLGDAIVNENLPWPTSINGMRTALGIDDLTILNDFEALAFATQFLDTTAPHVIFAAPEPPPARPVLVMGPGTGLGSAVLLPGPPGLRVMPTEAGQIAFAPGNQREQDVLRWLSRTQDHVSCESLVSGPGLLTLYRALCALDGATAELATPAAVSAAALDASDAHAVEALGTFCGLLGSFAGDMAMLFGARGGVYLAGGIVPQIQEFLEASTFVERYLNKGVMRAFLEAIPVKLIEHGQLGVIGAASWTLGGGAGAQTGTSPEHLAPPETTAIHDKG